MNVFSSELAGGGGGTITCYYFGGDNSLLHIQIHAAPDAYCYGTETAFCSCVAAVCLLVFFFLKAAEATPLVVLPWPFPPRRCR